MGREFLEITLANKEATSAAGLLERLVGEAPFVISRTLTDNGK